MLVGQCDGRLVPGFTGLELFRPSALLILARTFGDAPQLGFAPGRVLAGHQAQPSREPTAPTIAEAVIMPIPGTCESRIAASLFRTKALILRS